MVVDSDVDSIRVGLNTYSVIKENKKRTIPFITCLTRTKQK